jgi:hypothetical protein
LGISGLSIKKSPAKICRVLLCQTKDQKAKGEEKPEEELMGKRKSSPRLATTSTNRCCYTHYQPNGFSIYINKKIFPTSFIMVVIVTYRSAMVG